MDTKENIVLGGNIMNEKEKQKLIEYLNLNFRAILSWGGKGVVPTGIFKVRYCCR